MLGVFRVQNLKRQLLLIYFEVKIIENGRKNIFRGKKTRNKIPPKFFDVNVLAESKILGF